MTTREYKKYKELNIFNLWMGQLHYYLQNKYMFAPGCSVILRYREDLIKYFMAVIKKT